MSSHSYTTTEVFLWCEYGYTFAEFFLCVSHKILIAQNIYRRIEPKVCITLKKKKKSKLKSLKVEN